MGIIQTVIYICPRRRTVIWMKLKVNPDILMHSIRAWGRQCLKARESTLLLKLGKVAVQHIGLSLGQTWAFTCRQAPAGGGKAPGGCGLLRFPKRHARIRCFVWESHRTRRKQPVNATMQSSSWPLCGKHKMFVRVLLVTVPSVILRMWCKQSGREQDKRRVVFVFLLLLLLWGVVNSVYHHKTYSRWTKQTKPQTHRLIKLTLITYKHTEITHIKVFSVMCQASVDFEQILKPCAKLRARQNSQRDYFWCRTCSLEKEIAQTLRTLHT